jgi:hypothetical protein
LGYTRSTFIALSFYYSRYALPVGGKRLSVTPQVNTEGLDR